MRQEAQGLAPRRITATRASSRTAPTARAKSGPSSGLAKAGSAAAMSRHSPQVGLGQGVRVKGFNVQHRCVLIRSG
jgi:hypothetical protein